MEKLINTVLGMAIQLVIISPFVIYALSHPDMIGGDKKALLLWLVPGAGILIAIGMTIDYRRHYVEKYN